VMRSHSEARARIVTEAGCGRFVVRVSSSASSGLDESRVEGATCGACRVPGYSGSDAHRADEKPKAAIGRVATVVQAGHRRGTATTWCPQNDGGSGILEASPLYVQLSF
jgi:hypothetical protein